MNHSIVPNKPYKLVMAMYKVKTHSGKVPGHGTTERSRAKMKEEDEMHVAVMYIAENKLSCKCRV